MPLYEYHCLDCKKDFDALIMAGRETPSKCPSCGSAKINQKISSFSAQSDNSCSSGSCEMPSQGMPSMGGGCGGCGSMPGGGCPMKM
jgi:putative FmdB family regulatory protein